MKKKKKKLKGRLKDHEITINVAANLTANYRAAQTEDVYVKAQFFGKDALQAMLNESNSQGIRMYYGLSDLGVPRLVLVGVDQYGNDMCDGIVLDRGLECPPECSEENSLNS